MSVPNEFPVSEVINRPFLRFQTISDNISENNTVIRKGNIKKLQC